MKPQAIRRPAGILAVRRWRRHGGLARLGAVLGSSATVAGWAALCWGLLAIGGNA